MDLLRDLTPAQAEAVTHIDGPLLVLAGPGSGKTRVITRRVVHLLRSGVRPWNILAITFTNKAAGEMRKRVLELEPNSKVLISTFHSLGARLLRHYADRLEMNRNFTIYDQSDRTTLVKESMGEAGIDSTHFTPDRVQGAISKAKNELKAPPAYASTANDFFSQTVALVYPLYEKKLRAANAVDFDDLLFLIALMLRKFPEIRDELDAKFRYIMIDEYQDTNHAQYTIARLLAKDHPNICVVGDPDQSIYRFRGSDIRNILDFERDYPQTKTITLDRNYRSTKSILAVADGLIAHNLKRKAKKLVAGDEEGRPVELHIYPSGLEEAQGIAKHIQKLARTDGIKYRDVAIFLRMNALSRVFETAFIKERIPYQIVRGFAFFERKENKDVLAYLRLLVNPQDDVSFRRVVNVPTRGIGDTSISRLEDYALPREFSLLASANAVQLIPEIKGKAAKGLYEFSQMMYELQKMLDQPAGDVIRAVLERSGYEKMLRESKDPEDSERLANVQELISAANDFEAESAGRTYGEVNRPATEGGSLAAFLEHITLRSDQDALEETDQVAIMTFHAAKGLEFPVVFMPAIEQGILPHERSLEHEEELEEERRLAFVGITRAEKQLIFSHARLREFRGMTLYAIPSPFLDEIPENHIQVKETGSTIDSFDYNHDDVNETESPRYKIPSNFTPKPMSQPRPSQARLMTGAELAGESKSPPHRTLSDFVVGATVRHRDYGLGLVRELSGYGPNRRIKVRFGMNDKTFILEKSPLEVIKKK